MNDNYNCNQLKSPVLFLVFNRPDSTQKVFNAIRLAQPKKLYIAADGPRNFIDGEYDKVISVRNIATAVDWRCEVKTLFRNENLGCKDAVSSAIDWFFKNESEGIILEDDCLPSLSFFKFCNTMLEYYRHDYYVSHISGTNTEVISNDITPSYYFSNINNIWGWATWKRTWDLYDVNMADFADVKKELAENLPSHFNFYIKYFDEAIRNNVNTWDFQYNYAFIKNGLVSIVPKFNLIKNIGFNKSATHTLNHNDILSNLNTHELDNIIHPFTKVINTRKDIKQLSISNETSFLRKFLNYSRLV
jgi:hypothetical protein